MEDVLAQGVPQQFAFLGQDDGLAQAAGQRFDPLGLTFLGGHGEHVALHRRRHGVFLFDTLEPGRQHHAEGQIGIAGRVGGAVLHTHGALVTGLMSRHPDQVRAADVSPRYERRSFKSGHQPLVRVDPLIGHQGDLGRVAQQTGDEPLTRDGEVVFVVWVEEGVLVALKQRLVDMHPGAVHPRDGLGHEGGVGGLQLGQLFDDQLGGHHVVGHGQGIRILQVYLVLAGGALMVRIFDRDTHFGQIQHRVPAEVRRGIA